MLRRLTANLGRPDDRQRCWRIASIAIAAIACASCSSFIRFDASADVEAGTDVSMADLSAPSDRFTCPPSQSLCSGLCVTLSSDVSNCGTCGHGCSPGMNCMAGTCACPPGQTACAGRCIDLTTDSMNCGSCGNVCSHSLTCTAGACTNPCGDSGRELCGGICTAPSATPSACGACPAVACATNQLCTFNAQFLATCCTVFAGSQFETDAGVIRCLPGTCPPGNTCSPTAGSGGAIDHYYCCPQR